MINDQINIPFAFFGSSKLSIFVLDELLKLNFKPSLIVTTPDKPQGRKLEIKPNVVKTWAIQHNVQVLNPSKLDSEFIENLKLKINDYPLFIVASYGKIIPNEIIELPKHKTLNIHPSLLPQYRGASPLPTAILEDTKKTGITIMQLNKEMDHGPIVAQREIDMNEYFKRVGMNDWPTYEVFEEMMAKEGAKLLAEIVSDWVSGKIKPTEQDHSKATYTKKINKEEAQVDLNDIQSNISTDRAYEVFRKIQAYHEWPQAYFFLERKDPATQADKKIRVKITEAEFKRTEDIDGNAGKLIIKKVIPEGKKEMSFESFQQGYLK